MFLTIVFAITELQTFQQVQREVVAEETYLDTVKEMEKLFPKVKGQPICQEDRHLVLK